MSYCPQAHYSADRIENTIKGKNILAGKSGGLLHRLCQGQWGHIGRDNGTEVNSLQQSTNPSDFQMGKERKDPSQPLSLYVTCLLKTLKNTNFEILVLSKCGTQILDSIRT